jgi:hypothetical protein
VWVSAGWSHSDKNLPQYFAENIYRPLRLKSFYHISPRFSPIFALKSTVLYPVISVSGKPASFPIRSQTILRALRMSY